MIRDWKKLALGLMMVIGLLAVSAPYLPDYLDVDMRTLVIFGFGSIYGFWLRGFDVARARRRARRS